MTENEDSGKGKNGISKVQENGSNDALDDARKKIDSIDEQITRLLAQRMALAVRTRREKEAQGKSVEDAAREKSVLQHVEAVAKDEGLPSAVVLRVFEEVMAASRAQQIMDHAPAVAADGQLQPKTIAFQGERGAYSEEALNAAWPDARPVPCKEFADVFDAVQTGKAEAGLVPIENSTEGSINWTYDLLLNSQLAIAGEKFLRVRHYLLAKTGTELKAGLKAYSHPQALAQCREFLHEKGLQPVQYYDTAGAARDLAQGKIENKTLDAAAIASRVAAEHYGLQIIAEGIEDNRNNYTRFILISKTAPTPQADGFKTSIVFSTQHKPGALFRVLKAFADAQINLTKLESRPTKSTPWEYVFYLDFEGSASHEPAKSVLQKIKPDTLMLKVLGSYPKAK